MSAYENVRNVSVQVKVTAGVPAALPYRFAIWQGTTPVDREVITHVPGANGAPSRGVLAMKPDSTNVQNGYVESSIALPDGGICLVELAEAVTVVGQPLRIGGNSTEVDGAAYKADATGDFIVGYALEVGGIGAIISFEHINAGLF